MTAPLGWSGILRLGLVQAALGAIVVLVTATLNRVMAVELALPAVVPGLLIALHYAVQVMRPRWGYGSDATGRRTPWVLGGMATLATGGTGAALAVAAIPTHPWFGIAGAVASFALVGLGVGAAGTSNLVLAATCVAPARRAVAASVLWITMIAGFAVTAGVAGHLLEPFSFDRLVRVVGATCGLAFLLVCAALWRLEPQPPPGPVRVQRAPGGSPGFRGALAEIWAEPAVGRFTLFVFVSMLAYSAEDLVLEPFAGAVLRLPPGGTTVLSGIQHGGALAGMAVVTLLGLLLGRGRPRLLGCIALAGCLASAALLCGLAASALTDGGGWPLRPVVFLLGCANGAFAVAAIGAMMGLATQGAAGREGLRMGLWGAAQAAAFGIGSCVGPALIDLSRFAATRPGQPYACVFFLEAVLFVAASWFARDALIPVRASEVVLSTSLQEAT